MSNFFSFISGTIVGAYIAQNYKIINIKNYSILIIDYLKSIEKKNSENNENNN